MRYKDFMLLIVKRIFFFFISVLTDLRPTTKLQVLARLITVNTANMAAPKPLLRRSISFQVEPSKTGFATTDEYHPVRVVPAGVSRTPIRTNCENHY